MERIKIVYRYPGRVVYGGTCLDVFPVHPILCANSSEPPYNNHIYKKHIFAQKHELISRSISPLIVPLRVR